MNKEDLRVIRTKAVRTINAIDELRNKPEYEEQPNDLNPVLTSGIVRESKRLAGTILEAL